MNIEKLYEERKKRGYSQEELANLCNVSRQAVSKWESGQSLPDTDKLLALSKALDVSIDYLLDNEDMSEQRVKVKIDYEDIISQERKFQTYEYNSKTTVFGLPLVHIHRTRNLGLDYFGKRRFTPKVAKGIIAIGDISIGVLSIGLLSVGVLSLGITSLGLLSLGVVALGLYSFGMISIGFCSVGMIAVGAYSLGVFSIGANASIGILSIGGNALGVEAFGSAYQLTLDTKENTFCSLDPKIIKTTIDRFNDMWLPLPLRLIISMITSC